MIANTHAYQIPLSNGQLRSGALLSITDKRGRVGWGDIAPLPGWSRETLDEAVEHLHLQTLHLPPSVSFALESAYLSLIDPLPSFSVPISAFLAGSPRDILAHAKSYSDQGYTIAKLKVGHLSFEDAKSLIDQLRSTFRLRVDVNRAWNTTDSLRFFEKYPLDAFDYVEEPFQNPKDLSQFTHPLAVDDSYPKDLSLDDLALLPKLKALVFKPTLQGGIHNCRMLHNWAKNRGISLVLSSSYESDVGHANIAQMAHRLSITTHLGLGTYQLLQTTFCMPPLRFSGPMLHIDGPLSPKILG